MVGLILLIALIAEPAPRPQGATTVAEFDFRTRPDRDFLLPDHWTRVIQPGYPFYVDVALTDEQAAVADRSLMFRLNGGHCALFSPRLEASDDYNYILQGQIKTVGLKSDRAFLLLEFLNERGQVLGSQYLSQKIGGTEDWTLLRIGPVTPPDPATRFLRIGCFSQHGSRMDLEGSVYFDDIWVGRLPRVHVTSSAPYRLFRQDQPKVVSVEVTGLDDLSPDARFYLFDEQRKPISEHVADLTIDSGSGKASWELPIEQVGFYHLDIALRDRNREILKTDYPVTVVRMPAPAHSDFALSAPPDYDMDHIEHLLTHSSSRWLKLPVWRSLMSPEQISRSQAFALFVERMQERGHGIVGAMEQPPPELERNLARPSLGIADVFLLPKELWSGEIEGLQATYGLKITRWQVGSDRDTSFEGLSAPADTLGQILKEMKLFGREVYLGVPWSWHTAPPPPGVLQFLSLSDAPPMGFIGADTSSRPWTPLAPETLLRSLLSIRAAYVQPEEPAIKPAAVQFPQLQPVNQPPELWVQLAAIPVAQYGRQQQLRDMFFRIVAAKEGNADCIVVTDIASPQGLYDPLGAPTELYTVWRTCAEYLGQRQYRGQLFTDQVENRIFDDGSVATVVLWSQSPAKETVVTGTGTFITDLWGRQQPAPGEDIAHTIDVGSWPILLTGCNGPLLRLQMDTHFLNGRISSEVGRQSDVLFIKNPFPFTLSGAVTLYFPPEWKARPTEINLQLPPGADQQVPIAFDIPQGMPQGKRTVSITFDVSADRRYQFTIDRPYRLGLDELDITSQLTLLPNGELQVQIAIANLLERPISLRCLLRAFQRNVLIGDPITELPPNQVVTRTFIIPGGADLLGRNLRLELRELNGPRQYNVDIPFSKE